MADSEYSLDNYKSSKISIGEIIKKSRNATSKLPIGRNQETPYTT